MCTLTMQYKYMLVCVILPCESKKKKFKMNALCSQLSCVTVMYVLLHVFTAKIVTIKGSGWPMVK